METETPRVSFFPKASQRMSPATSMWRTPVCSAIRKVTPTGFVTTFAGTLGVCPGSKDGTVALRSFIGLRAVDTATNLYVADTYNHTIRKITPARVVTTIAGKAGSPGSADGTGSAARFNYPSGIAAD